MAIENGNGTGREVRPGEGSSQGPSVGASPSAESGVGAGPPRRASKKGRGWSLLAMRGIVYGILTLASVLLVLLAFIRVYVTPQRVKVWLSQIAAQETGGQLEIARVEADILSGFIFHDVHFYPPKTGDADPLFPEQTMQETALFAAERVEVLYSLSGVLAGQVNVRALQVIRPKLLLRQKGPTSSLDGMVDFRKKKESLRPPTPLSPQQTKAQAETTSRLGLGNPSLWSLPLKIIIRNVGFRDLAVDLSRDDPAQGARQIHLDGIDLDLGLLWHGAQSRLSITVASDPEKGFQIAQKSAPRVGPSKTDEPTDFFLKGDLQGHTDLEDFTVLKIDVASRLRAGPGGPVHPEEATFFSKVCLILDYEKMQVDIRKVGVEIGGALRWDLGGRVQVVDLKSGSVAVAFQQSMHADLAAAGQMLKPLLSGLQSSGTIDVKKFSLEGTLSPAKVQKILRGEERAPHLSGEMAFENIAFEKGRGGIRVQGLSGDVKWEGGTGASASRLGLEASWNLNVDRVFFPFHGKDDIAVEGKGVSLEGMAVVLGPTIDIPKASATLLAKTLRVQGKKAAGWTAPFALNVRGNGDAGLKRASLQLDINWKGLAAADLHLDCTDQCARFQGAWTQKIVSLEHLWVTGAALLNPYIPEKFRPTSMAGAFEAAVEVRGQIPNPLMSDLDVLWKKGDVAFHSRVGLRRGALALPHKKLAFQGLDLSLMVDGNLREQELRLVGGLEKAQVEFQRKMASDHPGGSPLETPLLSLAQANLDLEIKNTMEGGGGIESLLRDSKTDLRLRIGAENLENEDPAIAAMAGARVEIAASQVGSQLLELKKIEAILPLLGLEAHVRGRSSFSEGYTPRDVSMDARLRVSQGRTAALMPGLTSTGTILANLKLASLDMQRYHFSGLIDFDDFSLVFAGAPPKESPLFQLEKVTGHIPIAQSFVLPRGVSLKAPPAAGPLGSAGLRQGGGDMAERRGVTQPQTAVTTALRPPQEMDHGIARDMGKILAAKTESSKILASKVPTMDYSAVKLFYPQRRPIMIQKIVAANVEMNDATIDLEWREDRLALNEYSLGFLGGQIQGDLQIELSPDLGAIVAGAGRPQDALKRISANMQMTRLDTRRILDHVPMVKVPLDKNISFFSDPYVDATIHSQWNLGTQDLGGSIDITTIGKEQLRMLLSYLDPEERDPSIGDIRKALVVGDVRQVSIPIKNGEIGLEVDIRALGLPLPTPKLTRFPMSQILENATKTKAAAHHAKGSPS